MNLKKIKHVLQVAATVVTVALIVVERIEALEERRLKSRTFRH